ncbi:hypothetical protein AcV5_009090 [Taiwanofungus camphoratus]|nr:hypothetical protein AcV5_009090 [Antrodia cinnamomea]
MNTQATGWLAWSIFPCAFRIGRTAASCGIDSSNLPADCMIPVPHTHMRGLTNRVRAVRPLVSLRCTFVLSVSAASRLYAPCRSRTFCNSVMPQEPSPLGPKRPLQKKLQQCADTSGFAVWRSNDFRVQSRVPYQKPERAFNYSIQYPSEWSSASQGPKDALTDGPGRQNEKVETPRKELHDIDIIPPPRSTRHASYGSPTPLEPQAENRSTLRNKNSFDRPQKSISRISRISAHNSRKNECGCLVSPSPPISRSRRVAILATPGTRSNPLARSPRAKHRNPRVGDRQVHGPVPSAESGAPCQIRAADCVPLPVFPSRL